MEAEPAVLVIGAGPAGSSCALRLRQHGIAVDLVERESFPRLKVCGSCLGGAGLAALDAIGMLATIRERGVDLDRWEGSIGQHRVSIDLPRGLAISRQRLDVELLRAAVQAGASLSQPCRASLVESTSAGVVVDCRSENQPSVRKAVYPCVVVAAGLKASGLTPFLPWVSAPGGPFGAGYLAKCDERCEPGVVYMACHDDGYVGVVRLEDGRADVAAALQSGGPRAACGKPQERIQRILADSKLPPLGLSPDTPLLATPPLRRSRIAGRGRLLAIGDAAGYVEPFTGEGITWAIQSGIAAADLIASDRSGWLTVGDQWRQIYAERFRSPKLVCGAVTAALRSSMARRAVGQTLATWPGLAAPLIKRLDRGLMPATVNLRRPD